MISAKVLYKELNRMYKCHTLLAIRVGSRDLVDYKGYFTRIFLRTLVNRGTGVDQDLSKTHIYCRCNDLVESMEVYLQSARNLPDR
jgi:hypothetical protein